MTRRRYPQTTLYHVLAAYADAWNRAAKRHEQAEFWPFRIPPMTIGLKP